MLYIPPVPPSRRLPSGRFPQAPSLGGAVLAPTTRLTRQSHHALGLPLLAELLGSIEGDDWSPHSNAGPL